MEIIADLHIHSRYSRATSKELNIPNLVKYAKIKGITLLGTGDFTHELWLKELKTQLRYNENGMLANREGFPFILSSEISSIYKQDGAVRRVHNVILSPDFETVDQIRDVLKKRGVNIDSDGRPICGIPSHELVELVKEINSRNEIIPAHIWTPWFSLFGSKSGFDKIEDCYKDQTKHIHALETGLSSDPAMNWRLSQLDKYSLVSFSDLHSYWPWRIGREATLFDLGVLNYDNIIRALRTKDGLTGTIEVDPSYGKYHHDGHRACNVNFTPAESKKHNNICPVCKKPLTIGVLNRIEELADRKEGFKPDGSKPFHSLMPLSEIISFVMNTGIMTKKVWDVYNKLIGRFDSEINVLMNTKLEDMEKVCDKRIAKMIVDVRNGNIKVDAGYDGVYGNISKDKNKPPQKSLSDF